MLPLGKGLFPAVGVPEGRARPVQSPNRTLGTQKAIREHHSRREEGKRGWTLDAWLWVMTARGCPSLLRSAGASSHRL